MAWENTRNHSTKLSCVLHFGNGGREHPPFGTLVSTEIEEADFDTLL